MKQRGRRCLSFTSFSVQRSNGSTFNGITVHAHFMIDKKDISASLLQVRACDKIFFEIPCTNGIARVCSSISCSMEANKERSLGFIGESIKTERNFGTI